MKDLLLAVPYVSVCNKGTEIIASATLNIRTGALTEIEPAIPENNFSTCDREFIILSNKIFYVIHDENNRHWVRLHSGHSGPCTDSYLTHRDVMAGLSITQIIKAVKYITSLSHYLNDDCEILEEMDSIVGPLNAAIIKLRTDEICGHGCNSFLYKSDLPQYDYVCPECDENY